MRRKGSLDSSALSRLADDLQKTLGIKATDNTLDEVDQKVYRAVERKDQRALEWLTCQFAHLIMSIAYRKCFIKREPHTAKHIPYIFDNVNDEDRQDLVSELFCEFPTLVLSFDWRCTFNYYIKNKLEWTAINFWLKINGRLENEITTLDARISDLSANEAEELTYAQKVSEEEGMLCPQHDPREVAEGGMLQRKCDEYAKKHFREKKYHAYYYRIRLGWPMQQVAKKLGYKHHSAVSQLIREIKEELQLHLSKSDERYDEIYERINPHLKRSKSVKSEVIRLNLKANFGQSFEVPKIPTFMQRRQDILMEIVQEIRHDIIFTADIVVAATITISQEILITLNQESPKKSMVFGPTFIKKSSPIFRLAHLDNNATGGENYAIAGN